jgi:hypothetical protein
MEIGPNPMKFLVVIKFLSYVNYSNSNETSLKILLFLYI